MQIKSRVETFMQVKMSTSQLRNDYNRNHHIFADAEWFRPSKKLWAFEVERLSRNEHNTMTPGASWWSMWVSILAIWWLLENVETSIDAPGETNDKSKSIQYVPSVQQPLGSWQIQKALAQLESTHSSEDLNRCHYCSDKDGRHFKVQMTHNNNFRMNDFPSSYIKF